ncbi:hypothetical protein Q1695_011368 [Nippostrongylus brasiliensis]|nr:hypothetical protein Q1695_011368 [Nippostrongylus brasiliensis]
MSSSLALLDRGLRRFVLKTRATTARGILHTGHDRLPACDSSKIASDESRISISSPPRMHLNPVPIVRRRREYMTRHRATCHQRTPGGYFSNQLFILLLLRLLSTVRLYSLSLRFDLFTSRRRRLDHLLSFSF